MVKPFEFASFSTFRKTFNLKMKYIKENKFKMKKKDEWKNISMNIKII